MLGNIVWSIDDIKKSVLYPQYSTVEWLELAKKAKNKNLEKSHNYYEIDGKCTFQDGPYFKIFCIFCLLKLMTGSVV